MPLVQYESYITLPDGHPASDRKQLIRLLGGNVDVPIFADKAGQVPLANPLTTDADGLARFYAAPGAFYTELASEIFHFTVSPDEPDDVWPGVFVHEQTTPATVWTIGHHIGVQPLVTVLQEGAEIRPVAVRLDARTADLTFGSPQSGTALFRR